jgi:hypothetical protein
LNFIGVYKVREAVLVALPSQFVQQDALTGVISVKVVGAILGTHLSTRKKEVIVLTTLLKSTMKTLTSKK